MSSLLPFARPYPQLSHLRPCPTPASEVGGDSFTSLPPWPHKFHVNPFISTQELSQTQTDKQIQPKAEPPGGSNNIIFNYVYLHQSTKWRHGGREGGTHALNL